MKLVDKCEKQHKLIAHMYKHLAIPRDWTIQNSLKKERSAAQIRGPRGGGASGSSVGTSTSLSRRLDKKPIIVFRLIHMAMIDDDVICSRRS